MATEKDIVIKNLNEVFGAQKAEWLGPLLFDLFEEPSYFTKLTTSRPCFLVGGRGTGKRPYYADCPMKVNMPLTNKTTQLSKIGNTLAYIIA